MASGLQMDYSLQMLRVDTTLLHKQTWQLRGGEYSLQEWPVGLMTFHHTEPQYNLDGVDMCTALQIKKLKGRDQFGDL